ncbi:UNVERIFIED_CONTAM: hypothetical protein Sangu_3192800 [Sesamum angustifolium]|uniref:Uncharacterized protein n=1 Tax=Sesamum angustifolium TaxID=2727405 RepID=A0AAW2JM23_9LAMI
MTGILGSDSTRLDFRIEESWQLHAYEDCILDMARGGCVVRHGHHKPYPVQSEYVARTVVSKRGSVPCHYMTESSPCTLRWFRLQKSLAKTIDRSEICFLDWISRVNGSRVFSIVA